MIRVILPEKQDNSICEKNTIFLETIDGPMDTIIHSYLVVKSIFHVSLSDGFALLLDAEKKQYLGDDAIEIQEAIKDSIGEDLFFV